MLTTTGLIALVLSAHAFAPSETVHIGSEPTRIFNVHPQEQIRLAQSDAWQHFLAAEGAEWIARFDQRTGTPHRAAGNGLNIGPTSSEREVIRGVLALVERHDGLFGLKDRPLRLRSAGYAEDLDTWFVDFDALVEGSPIYRGGLTARIKHGRLVSLGADTYPGVQADNSVLLDDRHALARAIAAHPHPEAAPKAGATRLVALPWDGALRMAWEVRTATQAPRGEWVSFVDAESGDVLNVHNEVRYLTGDVWAEHDERTVDGNKTTSPVPRPHLWNDQETVYGDEFGAFEIADAATHSTDFIGLRVKVTNSGGAEARLDFTDANPSWESSEDDVLSQIDTYIFLHEIRDFWRPRAPLVGQWHTQNNRAYVNIGDSCNAYYDGNVNFFEAGFGCNNTGRIADVIQHEWGHGFHDHSLVTGFFDGAMSEGIGDTVAWLMSKDSVIAPYFMTSGSGIRDVAPDRIYPVDWVNQVHTDGLIFGGAMWDLYGELAVLHGEEAATDIVARLLAAGIRGGPTVETSFDEIIVADDDDGDLSNGTPNECEILSAFGRHGLGHLGGSAAAVAGFDPQPGYPAGEPTDLEVQLVSPAPNCFTYEPAGGVVYYRINGASWEVADLTVDADSVRAQIPGQSLGDFVEYYIEIDDASGQVLTAPTRGPIAPYTYYVGDVLQVRCNDFEDGDGGFTSELVAGQDVEGANDWQWGRPMGEGGDPDFAHSGANVWGNDLGSGDYNGQYQNSRHNRLTSPVYDLGHYQESFLHFWRWLQVEDGVFDQATVWADGELVWSNWGTSQQEGTDHTQDDQWMPHAIPLGEAGNDGELQLAWEIQSDQGLTMGGWTLDDVCILAPATPDNRLGISDFQASNGVEGGVTLSWTNPRHAPVERVVVVRSPLGMPSAPTGGQLVYDDRNVELGAAISWMDDRVVDQQPYYYAAFASDGADWLSWSVEGWNADDGDAIMPKGAFGGGDEELAGCGCTATPGPSAAWFALLLPGLLYRRRR